MKTITPFIIALLMTICGTRSLMAQRFSVRLVNGGVEVTNFIPSDEWDDQTPIRVVIPSEIKKAGTLHKVVGIASEAFKYQKGLEFIRLPESLEYIDEEAFSNCSNLKQVDLGGSLKRIGHQAFYGCESLVEITLPASLEELATEVFWNCYQLKTINVKPGSSYFKSVNGVVLTTDGQEVVCMPDAWAGEFRVPQGVKRLRDWSMVSKELKAVTLPEGLGSIGKNAFFWDTNLERINLPHSLKSIGEGAFVQCRALKAIDIPNGVTILPRSVFYHCNSLKSVKLPSTLKVLDEEAFNDCENLESIILPKGLTTIGSKAFNGCNRLQQVYIPTATTEIGEGVFGYCKQLTTIEVDAANGSYKSVDDVLFTADMQTLIAYPNGKGRKYNIPEGVHTIAPYAFFLTHITELTMPESLTTIGENAFYGCDELYDVRIPSNVEIIDDRAFEGCYHLEAIHLPAHIKKIGEDAINPDRTTVYVPNKVLESILISTKDIWGRHEEPDIKPESAYKPQARYTAADLILKPLAQIEADGSTWDKTPEQLLSYYKKKDLNVKMAENKNFLLSTNRPTRFVDASLDTSYRLISSRIYANGMTDKVEMLESSIDCYLDESKIVAILLERAKELGFQVKRDDTDAKGGVILTDKSGTTLLLILPDVKWSNVYVATMPPQGQYTAKALEQMDMVVNSASKYK